MEENTSANSTKEFAGKGIAGTGLGLGIAGTALGLMAGGLGGNGGLGGIFGGGGTSLSQQLSDTKAELARVNAERYTDQSILVERDRHLEWVKTLAAQDEKLRAIDETIEDLVVKNATDIANLKENIALQNQIDNLKAEKDMLTLQNTLQSQIAQVANQASLGIQQNGTNIASLANTVANLTKVVIPSSNVCNTNCGCGCSVQQ